MSQLGRIGGQVLADNLLRAGVDLAFETDLLYLNVNTQQIGIRDSSPIYDLHVNSNIRTNEITVINQAAVGNLRLNAPNTFSTSVGGIDVYINGEGEIFHDRVITNNLIFDDNIVSSVSNANIVLNPNGSGTVELRANTNITGNLAVSGNININGNLSSQGTLTFGNNQTFDTVTINTDFTQSIIPGDDATYALGADAGDSTARRWSQVHARDWTGISTGAWPGSGLISPSVTISDQINIDGLINKISAIQSNEDVLLNPDTGSIYIESMKFVMSVDLIYTLNNPNPVGTSDYDYFGSSVAISGSRLIVGAVNEDDANNDSGKAYVYDLDTNSLLYTLNNPNAIGSSNDDNFGNSVGISELYAIVGARGESNVSAFYSYQGKAYIFNAATGALLHTLNNPNPAPTNLQEDMFGWQVAISGSQAIVSAPVANGAHSGSAHIFNAATGALLHTLNNPNPFVSIADRFGYSAAISASYAIVGAPQEDETGYSNSGKAYIFNAATGALLFTLNNPNSVSTPASDLFGASVAISESYAVVGTNERQAGTLALHSGVVYIFDPATGSLLRTLTNPNPFGQALFDKFGSSVAISGSLLVVGASYRPDGPVVLSGNVTGAEGDAASSTNRSGKAYIFDISTGALLHTINNPNAFGTVNSDYFGNAVSISDSYIVAATHQEDDAAGLDSGKAYVYQIEFDQSIITNQLNTPLTFSSTGIGYLRFTDTNGFLVPAGTSLQRRASPEVGETRWNTQLGYLECYDGTVWAVGTGGGISVNVSIMEDLGHAYTLMLG